MTELKSFCLLHQGKQKNRKLLLSLKANTAFVKQSFFDKAPALWNHSSSDIRTQVNYEKVRKDLKAADANYSAEIIFLKLPIQLVIELISGQLTNGCCSFLTLTVFLLQTYTTSFRMIFGFQFMLGVYNFLDSGV